VGAAHSLISALILHFGDFYKAFFTGCHEKTSFDKGTIEFAFVWMFACFAQLCVQRQLRIEKLALWPKLALRKDPVCE